MEPDSNLSPADAGQWPDVPEARRFGGPKPPAQREPDVNALLTAANAARVRSDWREAESLCAQVLRVEPNNLEAHARLGDVCVAQGKTVEAAQWYDLAMELAPDAPGLKRKADAARLAAQNAQPDRPAGGWAGRRESRWLAWTLGALVVVFAVMLVAIALLLHRRQALPAAPPPAPETAVPADAPSPAHPADSSIPIPPASAAVPETAAPVGPDASAGEQTLQQQVSHGLESEGEHALRIASVQIDPRTHSATITLSRHTVGRPDPATLERDFRSVSGWAFAQAPDVQRVIVRELARVRLRPDAPPTPELIAIQEVSRPMSDASPGVVSPSVLPTTGPSGPTGVPASPGTDTGAPAANAPASGDAHSGSAIPGAGPPPATAPATGSPPNTRWLNPDLYPTPAGRP